MYDLQGPTENRQGEWAPWINIIIIIIIIVSNVIIIIIIILRRCSSLPRPFHDRQLFLVLSIHIFIVLFR